LYLLFNCTSSCRYISFGGLAKWRKLCTSMEHVQMISLCTGLKHVRPFMIIFTFVSVWLSVAQLLRGVTNFELWSVRQILHQYLFNPFKLTGYVMHNRFNIQQLCILPTLGLCFIFIWEQTATCATCAKDWLVFITEMKSVYSAVRTGSLTKAACAQAVADIVPTDPW